MFNVRGLLGMIGNYEDRCVGRYKDDKNKICVSTVAVTDSDKPYETAIVHPRYDNGKVIIVQMYSTKDQAENGHKKWIKIMTSKELPKTIRDVSTADIAKFCDAVGGNDSWRVHPKRR